MRPPRTQFVQANASRLPFPDGYFHCVVTSIPYYRQRQYGDDPREVGREQTPAEYVAGIVNAFEDVARVMRRDATLFLNVGDTYSAGKTGRADAGKNYTLDGRPRVFGRKVLQATPVCHRPPPGFQGKEQIGIPWMIAFAMREAGWLLRQEIIWAKSISFGDAHAENVRRAVRRAARAEGMRKEQAARIADAVEPQIGACMPSSVTDRCTTSHETVFMFTGSPDYFADMEPLKERGKDWGGRDRGDWKYRQDGYAAGLSPQNGCEDNNFAEKGRNLRSVWTINTQPYHGSGHYATYPEKLAATCLRIGTSDGGCCAGCGAPFRRVVEKSKVMRERPNELTKRTGANGTGNKCANTVDGVATRTVCFEPSCRCIARNGVLFATPEPCRVLDPFGGVATTALAANALGRDCVIVDLYPKYLREGRERLLKRNTPGGKIISEESETPDPDQLQLIEANE